MKLSAVLYKLVDSVSSFLDIIKNKFSYTDSDRVVFELYKKEQLETLKTRSYVYYFLKKYNKHIFYLGLILFFIQPCVVEFLPWLNLPIRIFIAISLLFATLTYKENDLLERLNFEFMNMNDKFLRDVKKVVSDFKDIGVGKE
jgi:hypothetical protein